MPESIGLFDLIAEALDNSMDVDWSSSVGARYVMEALETVGVTDASLRAKLPLEDMARRLRAAYIVVTQSTMWPTDEQFLEMLTLMSKVGPVPGQGRAGDTEEYEEAYDLGRRDMLNAILALNQEVAKRHHEVCAEKDVEFTNHDGKLPFSVVVWVYEVATQLGIEPKEIDDV